MIRAFFALPALKYVSIISRPFTNDEHAADTYMAFAPAISYFC
jgi:hypothetical protein